MSKEATGQFGAKIGGSEYWSGVNHATILGGFMGAETSYQAILRELGQRASAAIEEIHGDLSNLGGRIRYLSASDINALAKQVEGLYDVCKMSGVSPRHSSECVQGLNLSIMSPWNSGFRDERGIERALSIIRKSPYSGSEAVNLLREAAEWSISFAAGGDKEKQAFLETAAQGNLSSRFLQDVADEYENQNGSQRLAGGCGHTVGSRAYMTYMEARVFQTALPSLICAASGNPDYEKLIKDALNSVTAQLSRDLDNAARENDYITDETADKLKAVVGELTRCGVSTGILHSKIEKLAWFVGGDPAKIKELQKKLNEFGFGDHLKEDGVFGEKTAKVWVQFIRKLERGVVPTLAWTDLLQTKHTGIKIGSTTTGAEEGLKNAFVLPDNRHYIRFDKGKKRGKTWVRGVKKHVDYNHINIDDVPNSNWLFEQIRKNFDHYPLSDKAYKLLTHLDDTAKEIRVAGKRYLADGLVIDALMLGDAIIADIKDPGKKPDKTVSSLVSIGSSWGGSAFLTKIGAMIGVATGPAAPFAIPVLAVVGGVVGSVAGDRLADYLIDITNLEE